MEALNFLTIFENKHARLLSRVSSVAFLKSDMKTFHRIDDNSEKCMLILTIDYVISNCTSEK